jgi:putative endonuclease
LVRKGLAGSSPALGTLFIPMFFVYVLRSEIRPYTYAGLTDDLERRVGQHQAGYVRTTKPYRPFILIHTEQFATRPEARAREKFFKSGQGREFLKALRLNQNDE